ncbi:hypothetical protein ELE36_14760 [Pseudolysobacter antarcticus]|uniref:Uncharacterized protein n=1 Tax=Pseudolysobacter antarcticus TaxID=2511995 RepID=A0A411HM72_9GAMM|nr:hypothetical protein [Pseudolysobacter antarcticus]QBB71514.1 hypothetical protein ELE36_14760 [Pseudolysobacter antarcticus]
MPAPESTSTHPTRRNWDGIAALIAALIGLLALCVSAYTAHIQREQARAQVWTQLQFGSSDPDMNLLVVNKGIGPARIESLRLYVDGKAQPDWKHVMDALGVKLTGYIQSTASDTVIAAGEKLVTLKINNAEDWKLLREQTARIRTRACYCSVLDDCRVFDNRVRKKADADVAVDRCERSEDEEFTE